MASNPVLRENVSLKEILNNVDSYVQEPTLLLEANTVIIDLFHRKLHTLRQKENKNIEPIK